MSALGRIFGNLFDSQRGQTNAYDAIRDNAQIAREHWKKAKEAFKSPYVVVRDSYRAEPTKARGLKRLGVALLTGVGFLAHAVKGAAIGTMHLVTAFKNGAVDNSFWAASMMFDGSNDAAATPPSKPTKPNTPPAKKPAPAPAPAPSGNKPKVTSRTRVSQPQ